MSKRIKPQYVFIQLVRSKKYAKSTSVRLFCSFVQFLFLVTFVRQFVCLFSVVCLFVSFVLLFSLSVFFVRSVRLFCPSVQFVPLFRSFDSYVCFVRLSVLVPIFYIMWDFKSISRVEISFVSQSLAIVD